MIKKIFGKVFEIRKVGHLQKGFGQNTNIISNIREVENLKKGFGSYVKECSNGWVNKMMIR